MNHQTRATWKCAVFTFQCAALLQAIDRDSPAAVFTQTMGDCALHLIDCVTRTEDTKEMAVIVQTADNLATTVNSLLQDYLAHIQWNSSEACA